MLAQNFKSADELGITDQQKEALMKTLVLMETGRLIHVERPKVVSPDDGGVSDWKTIIPAQAATALRSYLTTGDSRWDLAVA